MKFHSQNNHDEDLNDPIARQLRRASFTEQGNVTGASEFANRLRAKIEGDLIADSLQPDRLTCLASRNASVEKGQSRGTFVTWVAVAVTLAAALLVLAPMLTANRSSENHSAQLPSDSDELPNVELPTVAPPNVVKVSEDFLPAADAERGLQLVNTGIGQTLQSVDLARKAIREMLGPLKPTTSKPTVKAQAIQQPSRTFGFADDQLVASFTAKVLGLQN